LSDGGTQEDKVSALLDMRVQAVRLQVRKIPSACKLSCDGEGIIVPKFLIPHCQEKPLARKQVPVPQTDTGSRGENPKVCERTLVKELGKMTP
jgi:hypothetical protein